MVEGSGVGGLPAISIFLRLFALISWSGKSNQTLVCCLFVRPSVIYLPGPVIHKDLN